MLVLEAYISELGTPQGDAGALVPQRHICTVHQARAVTETFVRKHTLSAHTAEIMTQQHVHPYLSRWQMLHIAMHASERTN